MGRWSAAWRAVTGAVATVPMAGRPAAAFAASYQPVDLYLTALRNAEASLSGAVSRKQALSVAAVQRVRNKICSIGTLPIYTYRGLVVDTTVHPLLRQINPDLANVVTLAETLEDLLFDGLSWWRVTSQDFDSYPLSAKHVPLTSVSLKQPPGGRPAPLPSGFDARPVTYVWVDGEPVEASLMIRFDSPNPGLLSSSAGPIKRALLLDRLAATYANNPRPLDYFEDSPDWDGDELTDDAVAQFLAEWAEARRQNATAKIPSQLKYNSGTPVSAADMQLVELQRQASLEIANGSGIDPEDIGLNTTSRTYFNAQDRRISTVNETFAPYMSAVQDRLSMGDVTRRGYTVRFDLTDYLKADIATLATVAVALTGAGIMTTDEARPWFNLSGPAPAAAAPAPDPVAPDPAAVAATRARVTFSDSAQFTATSNASFAVDTEKRTIRGIAVPFGVTGTKWGQQYVFDGPGSIQQPASGNVKHFIDHVTPIGRVTDWQEKPDGLHVAMSVMPGDEGDRLLQAAQHGVFDGLSVGIDWDGSDPQLSRNEDKITFSAKHPAVAREISTTAIPVFDAARVTSVAASRTGAAPMKCPICGHEHNASVSCATAVAAFNARTGGKPADPKPIEPADPKPEDTPKPDTEPQKWTDPNSPGPGTSAAFMVDGVTYAPLGQPRPTVDPTQRPAALTAVAEALPYRFSRKAVDSPLGRRYDWQIEDGSHSFGADLRAMMYAGDTEGHSEFGKRVMAAFGYATKAAFAGVASTDVSVLNPAIQRPDMYVDVPDYRYPIMALINRGAPPNGIQPFTFPKFNTSSTLVAAHTEGTEPAQGSFTATSQTITPSPSSGEVNLTRETIDMGGNPAAQTLVFNKMLQAWFEALETNAATFLNTLTAAADLALNTGATAGSPPTSAQLYGNWVAALSGLPFLRGYDFTAMVIEQNLYQAFCAVVDTTGRPLFPMLGATNANGQTRPRYTSLDLGGVTGVPSWALTHTVGSLNNSWLFDPATVYAWATQPQRLDFPGRKPADGSYAPVAWVGMGIWGYTAFANTDINGVKQVTYDTTT